MLHQSGRVHIAYLIECLTSKRYAVHTVHGYQKFLAQTGLNTKSITQHFTETAAEAGYSAEKWRWLSSPPSALSRVE